MSHPKLREAVLVGDDTSKDGQDSPRDLGSKNETKWTPIEKSDKDQRRQERDRDDRENKRER